MIVQRGEPGYEATELSLASPSLYILLVLIEHHNYVALTAKLNGMDRHIILMRFYISLVTALIYPFSVLFGTAIQYVLSIKMKQHRSIE